MDGAQTAQLELPVGFGAAAVVRGAVLWDVATTVQKAGLEVAADAFGPPIPAVCGQAEGGERYFAVANHNLTPEELKAAQALSAEERLATLRGEPDAQVKAKYAADAERHIAVYAVRP